MGGKSKSNSFTTNQNYNYDERVAASDGSVVFSNNVDGNNNTVTDMGAISESFEFANNMANKSFEFASDSQSRSYQALNDNTKLAFQFANNATISADERVVNKMLPLIIIGGCILVLALILKGGKKK